MIMARKNPIKYAYFVENVSRKFTLRKNKCSQDNTYGIFTTEPTRYMGGAVRQNSRFGYGLEQKNYMFLRFNPRSTAVSSDERQLRTQFATAVALRKAWKGNLQTVAQLVAAWGDQTNGSAKGVHKLGYTFNGWLFAVAYAVVGDGGSAASEWPGYVAG